MSGGKQRATREPYEGEGSPARQQVPAPDFSDRDREGRTGRGYLAYPNGTVYEGEWKRGERHGLGACFYPSGNIYIGQFVEGEMEGEGTMLFATGDFFTGEFRKSQIRKGVFSSQAEEFLGEWENGVLVKEAPLGTPETLKRAHAALFATVVSRVHQHFQGYAREGGSGLRQPVVPTGGFLSPPTDMFPRDTTQVPSMGALVPPGLDASDNSSPPIRRSATTVPQTSTAVPVRGANSPFSVPIDAMSVASERHRAASSVFGADEVEKHDLRAAMTKASSHEAIFVGASPSCTEHFSLSRFATRLFVFLFPFLSLPWVPFAPLRITSLEEERDFVVSGGTLGRDFDPPTISLVGVAVAVCCQVASIVIVACKVTVGHAQEGRLTLPEMVIPCVLWVAVGLFCAAYNSYFHVPHALERLDRKLTPKLTAFAASVVDAKSAVCIYTWDDEGRGKVRNRHYRYRWIVIAVLEGAAMSLSAPATRAGMGHGMFGDGSFEMAAALLAFFATFFFSTILSYYVLKLTDMQREVRAKLRVLTELAFLEDRSIVNPSAHIRQPFDVDLPFDPTNLFRGFAGWYAARSIVLYASACANHRSRSAAMSFFTLIIFFTSVVALSDVFKALAEERLRSGAFYSTAHSYGFFVLLFWGTLLLRYFYSCAATVRELRAHESIMDTVSLYHRVKLHDPDAGETIQMCRQMVSRHDAKPHFFSGNVFPLMMVTVVALNAAGLAAIAFQLAEVIYY